MYIAIENVHAMNVYTLK